jgi:hypothetical protein
LHTFGEIWEYYANPGAEGIQRQQRYVINELLRTQVQNEIDMNYIIKVEAI